MECNIGNYGQEPFSYTGPEYRTSSDSNNPVTGQSRSPYSSNDSNGSISPHSSVEDPQDRVFIMNDGLWNSREDEKWPEGIPTRKRVGSAIKHFTAGSFKKDNKRKTWDSFDKRIDIEAERIKEY